MSEPKKLWLHCRNCMKAKPEGQSMREWSRISVLLLGGLIVQIICCRCDMVILKIEATALPVDENTCCDGCHSG